MRKLIIVAALSISAAVLAGCGTQNPADAPCASVQNDSLTRAPGFVLSDELTEVKIGEDGTLMFLSNRLTGHNYAGGAGLWRMFYNTKDEKEMQIDGSDNTPVVTKDGNTVTISYRNLVHRGKALNMDLTLTVSLEDGTVRFGSTLANNEPHTIIRELQYPLVGDVDLPEGHKLLTTHTGGQVFDDPIDKIVNVNPATLYMKPDQYFRQYDLQYPRHAASNCYAFFGEKDGLYFGSHDRSLQQTWHSTVTPAYSSNCFFESSLKSAVMPS